MGHFVYEDEIERIDFDDEEWVDILRKMSQGDRQRWAASLVKIPTQLNKLKKEDVSVELDLATANNTILLINIKAWSFRDRDEKIAPITMDNIKRLDPDDSEKISEEIQQRNPFLQRSRI